VAFSLLSFSDNKADVDLWGNVGFVRAWPWEPAFHRANTFSFTEPDRPWINHEWLSERILHAVHASLGNPGLILLKTGVGLALLAMMNAALARHVASGATRWLYLMLVVSTAGYGFSFRPHLFTYLMTALGLHVLGICEETPPRLAPRTLAVTALAAFAAGVLWANLHGAFFIGLVLIGVFAVGGAIRRRRDAAGGGLPLWLAAVAALSFGAGSLANPFGVRLWGMVAASAVKPRPYLTEWAAFDPVSQFLVHPDFLALVVLTAAALAFARPRPSPTCVILLALSLAAAISLRRNIPLFAVTCAYAAPSAVAAAGRHVEGLLRRIPVGVLTGVLAVLAAACIYQDAAVRKERPLDIEVPRDRFPADTIAFIKQSGLRGNMLVFFDWAEYAIWHLYPGCKVFLDGRFLDAYCEQVVDDYLAFLYAGPEAERALNRYPTDIVLLHEGNPACRLMEGRAGWLELRQSAPARLFVKRLGHEAYLASLGQPPVASGGASQPNPSFP
jgi:hypothetical protein